MPVTHDFSTPIPPGTVRVSVIHSGDCYALDLASTKIASTIQAFEDHAGPMSEDRCIAAAAEAANDGDTHLVTAAAVWLWLFQPVDGEINAERLAAMMDRDGSALLTAMVNETTGEWTHRLFAMPRWPVSAKPDRSSTHARRRWR